METALVVILVLAVLGLLVDRSSWKGERTRLRTQVTELQETIDSANGLLDRKQDSYLDICRRMMNGPLEQRQMLKLIMADQDAHKEAEANKIDPLHPS